MNRSFALLAVVGATLALSAGAGHAAPKRATISVTLAGPSGDMVIPWYGPSPLFQWKVASSNPVQKGTVWLEVSTTPTFKQHVLQQFDCGYTAAPCATSYRFKTTHEPYWYDLADSCSDLPPSGNCSTASQVFYWRVQFEPEFTARKISSAVRSFRRTAPAETKPPMARAVAGTSRSYGASTRFYYYASDKSGVTRTELELYDGSTVVYGAREDWQRTNVLEERYIDVVLPTAVEAGSYSWCVTVFDYVGNSSTNCAPYTITS